MIIDFNFFISYIDMYLVIEMLVIILFKFICLFLLLMWFFFYIVEWYFFLLVKYFFLRRILFEFKGDIKYMKFGLFSVIIYMVVMNENVSWFVDEGGLGFRGVVMILEGMV